MKRLLLVPALAFVSASCQDLNESATGPQEAASIPSFSHEAPPGTCLDLADHKPLTPGGGYASDVSQSPCDGRLNGGTEGFFFLPYEDTEEWRF